MGQVYRSAFRYLGDHEDYESDSIRAVALLMSSPAQPYPNPNHSFHSVKTSA